VSVDMDVVGVMAAYLL